ncbi:MULTISPECIES: UPF0058 family protein [Halolamina]|uniref:Metal-binding protein n=1 Tax=Halolamina pelagica TaxID=699431 RepID=A0A1I5QR00_9EURY|nr:MULTISPECIES: UPF0058 family protein [Halolamina]NHX35499.1 metal-binding protein [Halolamina sp. R1-12]SFP48652.1 hypothetical protein SAMN05216277_10442 [Halolamina pelagica]
MKKQELIHLHGLLSEVRAEYEDAETPELDLTDYREFGVQPTSIHRSKTDHKRAVFELVNGLTDSIDTEEPVTPTAD